MQPEGQGGNFPPAFLLLCQREGHREGDSLSNLTKRDSRPPETQGALNALESDFKELLRSAGYVMHSLWHSLTGEWSDDDDRGAELYLEWSDRFPATASHYRDLLRQSTPSAQFWAGFYFCSEVVAALSVRRNNADRKRMIQTEVADFEETLPAAYIAVDIPASVTIFDHLVQIGVRVVPDPVAWAKAQMEGMVQRHLGVAHDCWALERVDEADIVKALSGFERKLKERIEVAVRVAYLEAAKRPKPAAKNIERTAIEGSSPGGRENKADKEAEDRKKLIERPVAGKPLRYAESALLFEVSLRTIQNWLRPVKLKSGKIRPAKLKRAAKRGYISGESIKLRWERGR